MPSLPKPSRKARLARAKAEAQDARLKRAEVRHAAIERSGGLLCEWCRCRAIAEVHHVLYGVGRRVPEERLETLAVVCLPCHRGAHEGDSYVLQMALLWAFRNEYRDAMQDIQRRLAKRASRAKGDGR
jgi:hypothetical protein